MNSLQEANLSSVADSAYRFPIAAQAALITFCFIGSLGCRPSHHLETATAKGIVTLDGKPLSAGSVLLAPTKGRWAGGVLSTDGKFILTTYLHGDGAIVGKHKVAVLPLQSEGESNTPPPGYVPVPSRYQNATSSGLEVEVKEGEDNFFQLNLTSSASP